MRVLVTAPGGLGHLHPVLPLTFALRNRGHEVVLAADPDSCAMVSRTGIATLAAGLRATERQRRLQAELGSRRPSSARDHGDVAFPYGFGAIAMPAMLSDLRRIAPALRPDLIIHDAAELAGALVAAELGVRHATHSFGTTVLPHRLARAGELTAHLWSDAGLPQPDYAAAFEDIYVNIRPPSLPGQPPPGPLLLHERPTPSDVVGGQSVRLKRHKDTRPVVYVTLGTVFNNVELIRMTLDALATSDTRVLVTVGPRSDPAAVGPQPPHVQVERYVPQAEVLPQCDLVISHAGSGTFLGALAHAIPQLCLPQGADQFLNADAGIKVGAAIAIEPPDLSSSSLRDAIRELLEDGSYRTAAHVVADEISAMPSPTQVARRLEELIGQ